MRLAFFRFNCVSLFLPSLAVQGANLSAGKACFCFCVALAGHVYLTERKEVSADRMLKHLRSAIKNWIYN